MIEITTEPQDAAWRREALLNAAFGAARWAKTAERLREDRLPADGLSFVAADGTELVGTIRFWHVRIGGSSDALLLGPVAVAAGHHGRGLGAALIRRGLTAARDFGHEAVILVGDEPYYRRFGFRALLTAGMRLPGPIDRRRFLALELVPAALSSASGLVQASGLIAPEGLRRAA
jgi:predicted N-acetyltransferase YhbS